MARKLTLFASVTAALLLGAAVLPAQALDISVGGISVSAGSGSSGGTSATASVGDTSATVTLGGGSNVASTGLSTGGTGVTAGVGTTTGPLIEANSTDGTTSANVNLGGLGLEGVNGILNTVTDPVGETLDGIDLGGLLPPDDGGAGGGGGGVGGGGGGVGAAFAALAPADQQLLRLRCRAILANPGSFDQDVVTLCRVIAAL